MSAASDSKERRGVSVVVADTHRHSEIYDRGQLPSLNFPISAPF